MERQVVQGSLVYGRVHVPNVEVGHLEHSLPNGLALFQNFQHACIVLIPLWMESEVLVPVAFYNTVDDLVSTGVTS